MTDPFKNQRYSSTSGLKSSASSSQIAQILSPIEEATPLSKSTHKYSFTNPNQLFESDLTKSPKRDANLLVTQSSNDSPKSLNTNKPTNSSIQQPNEILSINTNTTNKDKDPNDQAAFIQAHIDANKELINQLKSNIELLFKASKYYIYFCC